MKLELITIYIHRNLLTNLTENSTLLWYNCKFVIGVIQIPCFITVSNLHIHSVGNGTGRIPGLSPVQKSTFCFSFSVQMCLFFSTKLKSASCSLVKPLNFFFACGKKHMFCRWKQTSIWLSRKHITLIKLDEVFKRLFSHTH